MPIGRRRRAFSLVELVIVVVMLGIIAAVAVPRLSSGTDRARDAALDASLANLQHAVELYAAEHFARFPCVDAAGALDTSGANLVRRLTEPTNDFGGFDGAAMFGPYLRDMPANPWNRRRTIRVNGAAPGANTHGWHFNASTGAVSSDHADGTGIEGTVELGDGGGGVAVIPE